MLFCFGKSRSQTEEEGWGCISTGGWGLIQKSLHSTSTFPCPLPAPPSTAKQHLCQGLGSQGVLDLEAAPEFSGQRARTNQKEEGLTSWGKWRPAGTPLYHVRWHTSVEINHARGSAPKPWPLSTGLKYGCAELSHRP